MWRTLETIHTQSKLTKQAQWRLFQRMSAADCRYHLDHFLCSCSGSFLFKAFNNRRSYTHISTLVLCVLQRNAQLIKITNTLVSTPFENFQDSSSLWQTSWRLLWGRVGLIVLYFIRLCILKQDCLKNLSFESFTHRGSRFKNWHGGLAVNRCSEL